MNIQLIRLVVEDINRRVFVLNVNMCQYAKALEFWIFFWFIATYTHTRTVAHTVQTNQLESLKSEHDRYTHKEREQADSISK